MQARQGERAFVDGSVLNPTTVKMRRCEQGKAEQGSLQEVSTKRQRRLAMHRRVLHISKAAQLPLTLAAVFFIKVARVLAHVSAENGISQAFHKLMQESYIMQA